MRRRAIMPSAQPEKTRTSVVGVEFQGSELVVPKATQPGTREHALAATKGAQTHARLIRDYGIEFVERCRWLRELQIWEVYFTDHPKTWERYCEEVLGIDPDFIGHLAQAIPFLRPKPRSDA
jgi:hypothetical protein